MLRPICLAVLRLMTNSWRRHNTRAPGITSQSAYGLIIPLAGLDSSSSHPRPCPALDDSHCERNMVQLTLTR